ncbi:MAG: hypothetical protein EBZ81_10550 [Betaproteobacteria bacterium]|nr:hypothetical protein [Betaproteobacteria bacterium]
MAIRQTALNAVLRVARLREQTAATQAQRERKRLNDALGAADQLDQFAVEYRAEVADLLSKGSSTVGQLRATFDFAMRLEQTADQQREGMQAQKQRVAEFSALHQSAKLRLDGLEKIARAELRKRRQEQQQVEARETEDSITSRLYRKK